MAREESSAEMFVSVYGGASSVDETQDHDHLERIDDLERSAAKPRATGTTGSHALKNVCGH